jgi:hypothetical protein
MYLSLVYSTSVKLSLTQYLNVTNYIISQVKGHKQGDMLDKQKLGASCHQIIT